MFQIIWKVLECVKTGWTDGMNTRKVNTYENKGKMSISIGNKF